MQAPLKKQSQNASTCGRLGEANWCSENIQEYKSSPMKHMMAVSLDSQPQANINKALEENKDSWAFFRMSRSRVTDTSIQLQENIRRYHTFRAVELFGMDCPVD